MLTNDVPAEVQAVFQEFRTCEFSTFSKNGTPITWPTAPFLLESGQFLITSPIGIPQKMLHVRRNPRVSLLFSDKTGTGLSDPPAVLVQGDAEAPDEIIHVPAPGAALPEPGSAVTARPPCRRWFQSRWSGGAAACRRWSPACAAGPRR